MSGTLSGYLCRSWGQLGGVLVAGSYLKPPDQKRGCESNVQSNSGGSHRVLVKNSREWGIPGTGRRLGAWVIGRSDFASSSRLLRREFAAQTLIGFLVLRRDHMIAELAFPPGCFRTFRRGNQQQRVLSIAPRAVHGLFDGHEELLQNLPQTFEHLGEHRTSTETSTEDRRAGSYPEPNIR
jgi:hypothetical protein